MFPAAAAPEDSAAVEGQPLASAHWVSRRLWHVEAGWVGFEPPDASSRLRTSSRNSLRPGKEGSQMEALLVWEGRYMQGGGGRKGGGGRWRAGKREERERDPGGGRREKARGRSEETTCMSA